MQNPVKIKQQSAIYISITVLLIILSIIDTEDKTSVVYTGGI